MTVKAAPDKPGPARTIPRATRRHPSAGVPLADWAARTATDAVTALGSTPSGLTSAEVVRRQEKFGPNSIGAHHARPLSILGRQFKNAVLILLLVTAVAAFLLGDQNDAIIVGVILAASVGLGFINELRAERQSDALRDALPHKAVVIRDSTQQTVDVSTVVAGDIVRLSLGAMVPADLRLIETTELECNESVLTGESEPVAKSTGEVAAGRNIADLTSCALMGTVVSSGSGVGVVTSIGPATEFGSIAAGLNERVPETSFQIGLQKFSVLLLWVAVILSASIVITGVLLHRSVIETLLFALAIAVGVTPQLLPAVVSSSLAAGSRQLAKDHILVKRLVSIEDLGNVSVLVTDKTGTITEGKLSLLGSMDASGTPDARILVLGSLAVDTGGAPIATAVGANEIDACLLDAARQSKEVSGVTREVVSTLPFDHERMMSSVLVELDGKRTIIAKGAPEAVLAACDGVAAASTKLVDSQFAEGTRLIAIATREVGANITLDVSQERGLALQGFLAFSDPPRPDAAQELAHLQQLGIAVVIATGDNAVVAQHMAVQLGLADNVVLSGSEIDALSDTDLAAKLRGGGIAARISPEQKRRIVHALRGESSTVGFLGDGVNDALALHAADVGISVVSATDVARDAADVVLLDKSLAAVAQGVEAGRRIFGNTIKYILMGTSSNFGNMVSASAASTFLTFLPMLPGQVLLNNLLYDTSQLAISTDHVDEEQTRNPSHWNMGLIRHFMLVFGPASSLFDFATFALLLGVVHATPDVFRTGWFVESITTQAVVVFIIRTRRVPFFRSRPSWQLVVSVIAVVAVGWVIPFTPVGTFFGLVPLAPALLAGIAGLTVIYVVMIDFVKWLFYRSSRTPAPPTEAQRHLARVRRTAAKYAGAHR
jgi:Mg2+-importing ATPase